MSYFIIFGKLNPKLTKFVFLAKYFKPGCCDSSEEHSFLVLLILDGHDIILTNEHDATVVSHLSNPD